MLLLPTWSRPPWSCMFCINMPNCVPQSPCKQHQPVMVMPSGRSGHHIGPVLKQARYLRVSVVG